jgi:hypothetical protein
MWSSDVGKTRFCGASACQLHISGDLTFEHYKHIVSRRYLLLDQEGRCLARAAEGLREVPFEQEWRRVTGRSGGNGRHGDENGSTDRRETYGLDAGRDEGDVETPR